NPIAAALNARPKYVASTTLSDPQWPGTSVLTGDLLERIAEFKAEQADGYLLVPGSGVLVRWLLAQGLVDQLDLTICPVVVGQGTRLFPESGSDFALELESSRTTSGGCTLLSYRPAGRPQYAV